MIHTIQVCTKEPDSEINCERGFQIQTLKIKSIQITRVSGLLVTKKRQRLRDFVKNVNIIN